MIVAVNREEVLGEVEEGQHAAHSPHINSVSEGQAKGDFWSPEGGREEAKMKNLWASCEDQDSNVEV